MRWVYFAELSRALDTILSLDRTKHLRYIIIAFQVYSLSGRRYCRSMSRRMEVLSYYSFWLKRIVLPSPHFFLRFTVTANVSEIDCECDAQVLYLC